MIARIRVSRVLLPTLLALVLSFVVTHSDAAGDRIRLLPGRQSPPSLGTGEWLNTSGPIRLQDLRGKFVVLDFWTYCCINCMHILPELKKLERAYPNNVVVIGVHSAKFVTERDSENIREAILRHDIEHPVLVDSDLSEWRRWGVSVWPTLMVIDPEGNWIAKHEGEVVFEAFDELLKRALPNFRRQGLLDETPLRFDLERNRRVDTPLLFPGKVLADAASDRLFIADSAHHRIVIADLDGKLIEVVGSGNIGRQDGGFNESSFDHPQGMALHGDSLYVADTENHLIREVNLAKQQVTTIAGTGVRGRKASVRAVTKGIGMDLASPWDLLVHGNELFIANAGSHQIWRMGLPAGRLDLHAGNGVEEIIDGPMSPRSPYQTGYASFAQPSGLTTDGTWLYVADSEGSSIRAVPLDTRGQVVTIQGTAGQRDARLFTFGDRDGPSRIALLQHPVGIAYHEGQLFIADTYNNKVKQLSLARPAIMTIAGDGEPGDSDSPARFNEPMGLSVAGNRLFVADTNNHRIRVVDLQDSNRVRTLAIDGLKPPAPPRTATGPHIPPADDKLTFDPAAVRPSGGAVDVELQLQVPAGFKLNTDAPFGYFVQLAKDERLFDLAVADKRHEVSQPSDVIRIRLPLVAETGKDRIRVTLTYFYCRDDAQAICKIGTVNWTGQIVVAPDAEMEKLVLKHTVE